ncbi:hypothetical protein ACROYT_G042106 [Oculina patagonica]
MNASTKGSFINPILEDDKATSVETMPLEKEKQEKSTAEKETGRVMAAQGSNRALLALVITMCLISLVVLLLTLLMLFRKIGDGCGCSTDEGCMCMFTDMELDRNRFKQNQTGSASTVGALLTDTLVSGQLYLRPPFSETPL